jgi:hypothetical protein
LQSKLADFELNYQTHLSNIIKDEPEITASTRKKTFLCLLQKKTQHHPNFPVSELQTQSHFTPKPNLCSGEKNHSPPPTEIWPVAEPGSKTCDVKLYM